MFKFLLHIRILHLNTCENFYKVFRICPCKIQDLCHLIPVAIICFKSNNIPDPSGKPWRQPPD